VRLIITDITLEERLMTFDVDDAPEGDHRVGWIGNDCPILIFDDLAYVVLRDGSIFAIDFEGRGVHFPWKDYSPLLTTKALFKIFLVPSCLLHVSTPQPKDRASFLVDVLDKRIASQVFTLKDQAQLREAIVDCIESALLCDDLSQQQMLMMSAAFGKVYLPQYNNMEFASAIQVIRTRNLFRDKLNVIVPAEILRELDIMTAGDIVPRIAGRGLIAEVIEYADQLGCDKVPIVTDWCTQVISKMKDDQIAFKLISQKMMAAFDPTAVASIANSMGRKDLALQIAAAEKNRSCVVPFYMKLRLSEEALLATADSGDSTLFLSVLRQLVEQAAGGEEIASLSRTVMRDFFLFSALAKYVQSDTFNPKDFGFNQRYSVVLRIAQTLHIVFKVRLEALRRDPSEAKSAELLKFVKDKRNEFLKDVINLLKLQVKLMQQQAKLAEE
jgi:hypothetical protein